MSIQHKVMIVDDSKTYSTFAAHALQGAGYEVLMADNIFISRLVNEARPSLILMDVTLGRTSGVTAVTAIKSRNFGKGIKIYLHSSESPATLSSLCRECGADGFIEKNGNGQHLVSAVGRVLQAMPEGVL